MRRVDHICHTIVLDPGEANKFDSAKYCMHGIGMFPCAAFGLRLGLLLRVWGPHRGGTYRGAKDAVRLGRGCMERTGLWRGDLAGGMKWRSGWMKCQGGSCGNVAFIECLDRVRPCTVFAEGEGESGQKGKNGQYGEAQKVQCNTCNSVPTTHVCRDT